MTCPNCGTPVLSGVSSCRSCGASLVRQAVASYQEPPSYQASSYQAPAYQELPSYPEPPVGQAPYGPPPGYPGHAWPEPRRWGDVSALRVPLLVLLGADAVLALSIMVVPLAGPLFVLLFLVTAVVFVIWLRRARSNAVGVRHQFAPGWVIGGWFVPAANVYIPLRVVLDIGWAAVAPDKRGTVTGPVATWWAFWALSWLTAFRFTTTETVTATSRSSGYYISFDLGASWLNTACLALAAAALAVVVHRITVDQERAAASV